MRIRELRIKNFGPFRGEHVLELGPLAYAVVARWEGDAERSNYAGKSSLLEAVDFCLWGRHRHRLESGWITRGEREGAVALYTDDGRIVQRSRGPGGPTRLVVSETRIDLVGEEAQAHVAAMLGFGAEDFASACYSEQRQVARLVLSPKERFETVRAWLGLEPLERCESTARSRLGQATAQVARLSDRLREAEARLSADSEGLRERAARAEEYAGVAREAFDRASDRCVQESTDVELVARHAELVAHADKLDASCGDAVGDEELAALEADYVAALSDERATVQEMKRRGSVAFDGRCPVTEEACPAADHVRSCTAALAAAVSAATARHGEATAREHDLRRRLTRAKSAREDGARRRWQAAAARLQAAEIAPAVEAAKERVRATAQGLGPSAEVQLERAKDEMVESVREAERLRSEYAAALQAEAEVSNLRTALTSLEVRSRTLREAAEVLGRNGAQRAAAEAALARVQELANGVLSAATDDLRVELSWAHEGQGPARSCAACGAAFPSSTKVRACAACGAARGQHMVSRLDVLPSARSGAADDLCGLALQLAAGAWLRERRAAGWACALLDEPFAQLDRAHRRRLSGGLARMLAAAGYDQALVVSHDTATVDALPGRILVTAGPGGSRVQVV